MAAAVAFDGGWLMLRWPFATARWLPPRREASPLPPASDISGDRVAIGLPPPSISTFAPERITGPVIPLSSHGGDRPRRGGTPPPCLGHLCIDVMGCLVQVAYRPARRFVHLSASKCPCAALVSLARFDKRHKDAVPANVACRRDRTRLPPGSLLNASTMKVQTGRIMSAP